MAQLQFPNIVGAYDQGVDRGNALAFNKLAGQYVSDPTNNQSLLGQLAGLDPQNAMALQSNVENQQALQQRTQLAQQQMQAAQQQQQQQTLVNMAKLYSTAPPQAKGAIYSQMLPTLQKLGIQAPPTPTPEVDQIAQGIVSAWAPQKPVAVGAGESLIDPLTRKVVYQGQPKVPDQVAYLQALQQNPDLMSAAVRLKQAGRATSGAGATADNLLTPDAQQLISTALAHGYSIPLPSFGIGARGAAAKAQALNTLAQSFKNQGVSMDDAVSGMIQGKTGMAGLTGLQRTAANITGWENSASKQADIALGLSNSVDRTGVPLFNKWLLGGRQATGDTEVARFNNATQTLAEEYARVMGGGNATATDSTRALAHSMINSAQTQAQYQGVVNLMKQEMAARKQALHESVGEQRDNIVNKGAAQKVAGAPNVGDVEGGYRFKGGDPSNQANWEPAQ